MLPLQKAGVDAGNNSVKICMKGQAPLLIPTVCSFYLGETASYVEARDIPYQELEKHLDVTVYSEALKVNGIRYILGEKVVRDQLPAVEMEKKSEKDRDDLPILTTLAGLAIQAMKTKPALDVIEVPYDISVALPVASITPQKAKAYAERYLGKHTVMFHHPSGRDVKVRITIGYGKCLPEGAAAAWGIVYTDQGQRMPLHVETTSHLRRPTSSRLMLHVDMGAGTTELVVTDGVQFLPTLSEGLGYGVKETLLTGMKRWNRLYPRQAIDSIVECNDILFHAGHPRHHDVTQFFVPSLMQLARRMSEAIINKIDDLKDEPAVYLYGGGAAVLQPYLHRILEQKDRLHHVTFLKQPLFANAKGLLVYTCSPRFEQQKEQGLGREGHASTKDV